MDTVYTSAMKGLLNFHLVVLSGMDLVNFQCRFLLNIIFQGTKTHHFLRPIYQGHRYII